MFDRLTGIIVELSITEIVLDVNGVGYSLTVPISTSNALPSGGEVTLLAHLHVREDQLRLFGFLTEDERKLFRMLIGVSGIGPSIALAVLSGSSVPQFRSSVECGDCAGISKIKGIGKKTAERIIVDLRTSIQAVGAGETPAAGAKEQICLDAALALQSLGYTRNSARSAVEKALKTLDPDSVSTENLVRAALKFA